MTKTEFRKYHIEKLKDPKQARLYLEIALEEFEKDGNQKAFLLALRDLVKAKGGMTKLSSKIKMSRTSLYKTLSAKGNPSVNTFISILKGLGFRIKIEPMLQ